MRSAFAPGSSSLISYIGQPPSLSSSAFFFFNDTATPDISTLSLHDALPIFHHEPATGRARARDRPGITAARRAQGVEDRKSTRLNSSHVATSYAVFCLK